MSDPAQPAALYSSARYWASSGTLPRPSTVGISIACWKISRALACQSVGGAASALEDSKAEAAAARARRMEDPPVRTRRTLDRARDRVNIREGRSGADLARPRAGWI